jgi:hypothetical protein
VEWSAKGEVLGDKSTMYIRVTLYYYFILDLRVFYCVHFKVSEEIPVFCVSISSDELLRVEPRFTNRPACSPVTVFIGTHP